MLKIKSAFILGMFILLLICCGRKDVIDTNNVFDADNWVGKWVQSWNTYDLDQIDELFLRDDRLTYFSSEKEGAIIGFEAVKQHHQEFGFVAGGKKQPIKLWLDDLKSTVFGDTVVVTGIWYFQREDGSRQYGPVTIVYIKAGAKFLITHMNFSNYTVPES